MRPVHALRGALVGAALAAWPVMATAAPKPPDKEASEERTVRLLDGVLSEMPTKLAELRPEIRRLAFFSFQTDRKTIPPAFARTLQHMIEAAFAKQTQVQLFNLPEVKPLRLVLTEDGLVIGKGLHSTEERRRIADLYHLDGILEAALNVTDKNLFLDLKITDLNTGAAVWTHNFRSNELPPPTPKGFSPTVDLNLSLQWFQTQELVRAATTPPTILPYTPYYAAELRFTEPAWPSRQVDFVLKAGLLLVAEGTAFAGGGYVKTGLRTGLIRKESKESEGLLERSNWLAAEVDFGRIFVAGEPGLLTGGAHLEMDLTRHFSFGAGVSFVTTMDVLASGSTVRVGGVSFDVVALRIYF